MTSEEYGQYIDDFELGADVMPGESLTEYIERRRREFESKADGGSIGIEVLFGPKRKNFRGGGTYQGRGGYGASRSSTSRGPAGGASAGGNYGGNRNPSQTYGGSIFSGGGGGPKTQTKKPIFKSDIAPQFQGLVKPAAGVKFDFLKKQKFYNQPFKLEGISDLELAGAEAIGGSAGSDLKSLIKGSNNLTVGKVLENMAGGSYGNIPSSAQDKLQEQILGKVDFGKTFQKDIVGPYNPVVNPTFKGGILDIDVGKGDLVEEKAEKFLDLKDGGRVGFFMGGPALEGQALAIYNSMNAYGFSDQEIANALQEQGLYDPNASGGSTPAPDTGIIGAQLNQGGDDKPMIRPFREDPRVGSAFEAYQRNQALKAMGIEDPFADEISLQGAYYEDMPNVDLSPGKQTLGNAIKSGFSKVLNYPLIQGMSLMTPVGVGKEILKGLGALFPVNRRSIAENVAGNMGIAVDDIGRIVNTGNYQDPGNVMAGYNLNKLTDKSFDKRIGTISETLSNKYNLGVNEIQGILEGTLSDEELADINARAIMPGTNKTTNLIKQLRSINIAKDKNRFIQDIANKEAERQRAEKQRQEAKRIQDQLAAAAAAKDRAAALAAIQKQGQADYNPNIHGATNYGRDSQGNQSFDFGGGFGIGSDGGPVSNRTGRGRQGYMDGGIVDMLEIYD